MPRSRPIPAPGDSPQIHSKIRVGSLPTRRPGKKKPPVKVAFPVLRDGRRSRKRSVSFSFQSARTPWGVPDKSSRSWTAPG